jgi:CRP/FNR family transcriptional regulator
MAEFERIGREARFPARATVFMEGAPADAVYNVTSGLMRLFRLLPGGQRQIVGFALPGDFIGLPPEDRYGFSADAAVRTIACRFPRESFAAFAETHDDFFRRVHESAARALAHAHDQMMLLGPRRAEVKVAAYLLTMRRRWSDTRGTGALVPLPMGRHDIGDYLGLSIATVSRTLTRFERQRLILIVPQGVRILDLRRLDQLAAD